MSDNVVAPSPALVIAAGAVWPPLCAVAVALRFYTRRVQGASLMIDDWLTIPALIMTFGLGVALIYGIQTRALGYPTPPPQNPNDALANNSPEARINHQLVWSFQVVQIPALACVKLSFVYFYRRIFCTGVKNTFRHITTAVIVLIILWALAFEFGFLFICKGHFSAFWTSIKTLDAHCHPELKLELGFSSTDFITDLVVILLPLPSIWKLHMSMRRRVAVILVFCLGALTVAASITRMVIFIRAVQLLTKAYATSGANDLITTAGLYWSMLESGVALTAACLPTIYALSKRKFYSNRFETANEHRHNSMSSDARIVAGFGVPCGMESYAFQDLDPVFRKDEPPNGRIVVNRSFKTTENLV